MSDYDLKLYTSQGCLYCLKVTDFLEQHGLEPPEVTSLSTTLGSLPLVHLVDHHRRAIDLLVLPDTPVARDATNLVDGSRVSVLEMDRFRDLVDAARQTTQQMSGNG